MTHAITPTATATAPQTGPRFPHITVRLTGQDGNAFAIMGAVSAALRRNGVPPEIRTKFSTDAMACQSYDDLLATVANWVDVA